MSLLRDFETITCPAILILRRSHVRNVPNTASGHDHVSRGGTDATRPGTHMISAVEDHPTACQLIEYRCIEYGLVVVDFQILWGLVIDQNEQDIGSFGGCVGYLVAVEIATQEPACECDKCECSIIKLHVG